MSLFNSINMFNKFPKVASLRSKATVSVEELAAANEELRAAGINAFLVLSTEEIPDHAALSQALLNAAEGGSDEELTQQVNDLTTANEALIASNADLKSDNEDLNTEVERLTARVAELEKKPGEKRADSPGSKTKNDGAAAADFTSDTDAELDAVLAARDKSLTTK